ncbi:MAG: acyl-CoA dehydrogenase [Myxococcota bacterium]|jgi:acyl-CoA dehydrogenase
MPQPDLDAFRSEVRAYIEHHGPAGLRGTRKGRFDGWWGGQKGAPRTEDQRTWFEAMLARGWTAPTWPTEYGGGGLSHGEAVVLDEELARLKLPPALVGFGLTMIGPTLLDYGTAEQKAQHLPGIVSGDARWVQGYSEPAAGSDLAALATSAIPDHSGPEPVFVVNGQKIWTSHADKGDWIFCLVRTNTEVKKQAGITFLLIDMATPGMTIRPIALISGASPFCEVFLEDVRVPMANVVGTVDAGWTVAKALLGYERAMVGEAMGGQVRGAEAVLVSRARTALDAPSGPLPEPELRASIAQAAIDEQAFRWTTQRISEEARKRGAPGPESSVLKVLGSELKQRRWELAVEAAGLDGLGWEGPGFEDEDLAATREWLRSRANTIEGGSTEIQLNIIAQRVLGLER